jgi:hypothetical protein
MIARGKIEKKSREFGMHVAKVQRDNIVWLIASREVLRYSDQRHSRAQRRHVLRKAHFYEHALL